MHKRLAVLILPLFVCVSASAAKKPDDRGIYRALANEWRASLPHQNAPLVVAAETIGAAAMAPEIRYSLLRHGVPKQTAEEMASSFAERNARSATLPEFTDRLTLITGRVLHLKVAAKAGEREPALRNIAATKMVTLPGYDRSGTKAVVAFLREYAREDFELVRSVALLERQGRAWRVVWEQKHDLAAEDLGAFTPDASLQAGLTARDGEVLGRAIDLMLPEGAFLVMNETLPYGANDTAPALEPAQPLLAALAARNAFPSVIRELPLSRTHVLARAAQVRKAHFDRVAFGDTAAAVVLSLPAFSADGNEALVRMQLHRLDGDTIATGIGIVTFRREGEAWVVSGQSFEETGRVTPSGGDGPYRLSDGIRPPLVIQRVAPDYPKAAKAAGIAGAVLLETVVSADGNVEAVRVLRGLPHGLDRAAAEAARQWIFEPAVRDGKAVRVYFPLVVHFPPRVE